jgi:hypothetical protein
VRTVAAAWATATYSACITYRCHTSFHMVSVSLLHQSVCINTWAVLSRFYAPLLLLAAALGSTASCLRYLGNLQCLCEANSSLGRKHSSGEASELTVGRQWLASRARAADGRSVGCGVMAGDGQREAGGG